MLRLAKEGTNFDSCPPGLIKLINTIEARAATGKYLELEWLDLIGEGVLPTSAKIDSFRALVDIGEI